ncbi:MAG TPA: stage 0 sporulation family protein [Candidatus Eubacterium faecigallinarum]|nr:stage 0 sporulation family protein [Candidatus Eubacterium faecigallinarum]
MTKVVGVRFKDTGKTYYFDPKGLDIKRGQTLVVETAKGIECGVAQYAVKEVEDDKIVSPLKPVERIATEKDLEILEENKRLEKEALKICAEKIKKHGLEMYLTDAEYSFDRSKIIFFFTADGRVDFRELVKDLGSHFHTRIELRQIGVRDESRLLGGLGICGRPFCCSSFLDDFHSVTIKMAKDQGLSLAPSKISGTCGRLMCCLKYEQNSYEYLNKITPKKNSVVEVNGDRGVVVETSILTGKVKVQLDKSPDGLPVVVDREDVKPVRDSSPQPKSKKQ